MGCRILPFWLANFTFDMITGIYLWTVYIIAVFLLYLFNIYLVIKLH